MWTKLPERYFKDLEGKVKFEEPLSGHTTLRIGGPAQVYFEPQEPQDLIKGLDVASALGLEVHLLGRGSNLLVRDEGVKGMVVHLVGGRFARVKREGAKVLAGAALSIPRLLRKSISFGLAGLECLAGIPGTVGGAVVTNAGGRWGRISSSLDATGILNEGGEIHHLERTELDFVEGKGEVPGPILWAEFRLDEAEPGFLLERTQEILSQKKKAQPLSRRSAGSVFRNPPGEKAWRLIAKAGLRGKRCGGAYISPKHCNFIVNGGRATARDFLALVDEVRSKVFRDFGVNLELEIEIW
jgi:UDP-N-acetylmuramate dehydrogenase